MHTKGWTQQFPPPSSLSYRPRHLSWAIFPRVFQPSGNWGCHSPFAHLTDISLQYKRPSVVLSDSQHYSTISQLQDYIFRKKTGSPKTQIKWLAAYMKKKKERRSTERKKPHMYTLHIQGLAWMVKYWLLTFEQHFNDDSLRITALLSHLSRICRKAIIMAVLFLKKILEAWVVQHEGQSLTYVETGPSYILAVTQEPPTSFLQRAFRPPLCAPAQPFSRGPTGGKGWQFKMSLPFLLHNWYKCGEGLGRGGRDSRTPWNISTDPTRPQDVQTPVWHPLSYCR